MLFPIGNPLEPSLYLEPFSRYCALSVLGIMRLTFQGHVKTATAFHTDVFTNKRENIK